MKIQLRALSLYDAAGRRRAGGLKKRICKQTLMLYEKNTFCDFGVFDAHSWG